MNYPKLKLANDMKIKFQRTFTCSRSAKETDKGVKHFQ